MECVPTVKLRALHSHQNQELYMPKIDLSDYNLGELKGLEFEIDNEIRMRRLNEVTQARAQIIEIAQEAGVSVEELLLNKAGRPKRG